MANSDAREGELAAFLPLSALTLLGAWHELAVRQTDAYLGPNLATPRSLSLALAVAALGLGWWLGRRGLLGTALPTTLLLRLISAFSLVCSASGALWFWAFQAPSWFAAVALVWPTLGGALAGAALGALFEGAGLSYRELGSVRFLLAPLPLLAALGLALLGAIALTHAGLWRAAAGIGAALSCVGLLLHRFGVYFSDRASPRRGPAWAALAGALVSLGAAQAFVPAGVLARYPVEVVWTEGGSDEPDLVVTSAQNTFQLFQAQQLRLTSADAYRLAELAVHPALARADAGGRVLLLGPAGGFLERELLKHASVTELVSLSELGHAGVSNTLWPGAGPRDARLETGVAEPLPWLEREDDLFDAIFVALPAPASYAEGKYYTSYFFQLLERRLGASGVLVVQATSRATMPATFGIIERSLQSSGLALTAYEAPVPLLGAVSFILASRAAFRPEARRLPRGLRLLDGAALARAFALGAGPPVDAPISSLDHQRAVEAFHHEQSKLGN